MGVQDCHHQECTAVAHYIEENKNNDPLLELNMDWDEMVLAYVKEEIERNVKEIDDEHISPLKKKIVHGQYFKTQSKVPEINLMASCEWLNKAHLRFEMESLICVAQEQALATNNAKVHIWK